MLRSGGSGWGREPYTSSLAVQRVKNWSRRSVAGAKFLIFAASRVDCFLEQLNEAGMPTMVRGAATSLRRRTTAFGIDDPVPNGLVGSIAVAAEPRYYAPDSSATSRFLPVSLRPAKANTGHSPYGETGPIAAIPLLIHASAQQTWPFRAGICAVTRQRHLLAAKEKMDMKRTCYASAIILPVSLV